MSAHSPAPWVHAKGHGQLGSVEDALGNTVAQAQAVLGDKHHEQREANAALIAAAPRLKSALEAILVRISRPSGYHLGAAIEEIAKEALRDL